MKSYVIASSVLHGAFITLAVIVGTFLSKPRLSYYAVDLFSGPPPGAASPVQTAPEPDKTAAPTEPEAPAKPEPKSQIKDPIRIKEKEPKRPTIPKPAPAAAKPVALSGALRSLTGFSNSAASSSNAGTLGGSNLVAEASGPAFPFPWYLKAISDKLDKEWRPPAEFENTTVAQISFVIAREGAVSAVTLKKSSGNSLFDQLAMRAVQNASPMPPLPSGYPEDTLRVHMKFIGK